MTTVRDIMTDFAVTVTEDRTVADAARLLADLDVGSLPVLGSDERVLGVVTDRDIVVKVLARDQDAATTTVGTIVGGEPAVARVGDDVEDVLAVMAQRRVRRLPVLEGDQVVGLVALADVARALPDRLVGEVLGAISEPGGQPQPGPGAEQAQPGHPQPEREHPEPEPEQRDDPAAPMDELMGQDQPEGRDVVDVILERHAAIREQVDAVMGTTGDERQARFDDLVRMLAVHEAVEEELIHPLAQERLTDADAMVRERLAEEGEAKRALASLHDLGVGHPEFEDRFADLAVDVLAHAEAEEREELPALRAALTTEHLEALARLWTAAEALAPTRPHPAVGETGLANMVAGPPLMVFDRVRDVIRRANRP
ncbi:MAG: CBS domain-containing protein [Candidatus Nanopelagicales bacterium]|nr:CBS domain-containing protein [Candidatus Nanopelagicales bacterium]